MADPGNLIKADDTILTTIVTLDPIYAYFAIDERTYLHLQRLLQEGRLSYPDQSQIPVQLALADQDEFLLTGTIDFFDNRVDPATGTLTARAVIDNSKGMLSPGLFVRMRTPVSPPHRALLVPEEALGSDQGQRFLYVVGDDDKVAYRRVKVGQAGNGRRVVTEGLATRERVIASGLQRVRPGQTVTSKPYVSMPQVAKNGNPLQGALNVQGAEARGSAGRSAATVPGAPAR
jgi:RND family efflux transporter MFP subunit